MKKLNLRQKRALREVYMQEYSDLLWFLCYGLGGVCYVRYISLIFNYTSNEVNNLLDDLESIGFIGYVYSEGYKIIKVKSVTYDFLELSKEDINSKKRTYKKVNDSTQNILRSSMVCDYYLSFLERGLDLKRVFNVIRGISTLKFLNKDSATNVLRNLENIVDGQDAKDRIEKEIFIIGERFKSQGRGHENLKKNQLVQQDKNIAIENRERAKRENFQIGEFIVDKNKKTFLDVLFEKDIINESDIKDWEDIYTLSLKNVFIFNVFKYVIKYEKGDVEGLTVKFVILVNPFSKSKKVYEYMKKANDYILGLVGFDNTKVLFDVVSTHFTDSDIKELDSLIKKDKKGLLVQQTNCKLRGDTFINHINSGYRI